MSALDMGSLIFAGVFLSGILAHGAADKVDILAPAQSVVLEHNGTTQIFARATDALAAARTGDVVRLGPGTHRGPLVLEHTGVTLIGEPGARINANDPAWTPRWEKAPPFGRLAFASPIPFEPGAVSIDDRLMIDARQSRGGLALHGGGLGEDSRLPVQGVYTYLEKERLLVVSFADDRLPGAHRIEATPRNTTAVAIRGADGCHVRSLIVTGGETGIGFERTTGSTAESCLVYSVDTGVRLGKGASSCKVLGCDLTMNPDALSLDCDQASVGKAVWHAHKQVGTYDKRCVLADQAGDNNEVAFNYLYNMWDGIDIDTGVGKTDVEAHYKNKVYKGIADFNRGFKVHHNRLDLANDDALEPGDQLVDNEWYANVVTRARVAVRFKTISLGPFYFYDNVVLDSGTGLRLYKSMPACATVYIFNNVVRNKAGIVYLKMDAVCWDDPWLASTLPKGTPGFRIFNNVFVCQTPFANLESSVPPNFMSDYNLYTGPTNAEFPPKGSDLHSLFGAKPVFEDVTNGNWRLAANSPGRGAGCELSAIAPALPPTCAALAGRIPDMGLLGIGPEKGTPRGPTSGLWELAKKSINLGERDVSQFSLDPAGAVPLRPLWGTGVPGTGSLDPKPPAPANPPPTKKPAAVPAIVLSADKPVELLKNGTFEKLDASGAPEAWRLYGTAGLALEKSGTGSQLKVTVNQVSPEQGGLSQTLAGLPPNTQLVLTGTVKASKAKMAYLQIKLKAGKKEIKRFNSALSGLESAELKVECATLNADTLSVTCKFSQEAAGDSVWFSDLKLLATAPP